MIKFYSPPFYSPSLIELERGNNRKKIIRIDLLFFKREGKGVNKAKQIPLSPEGA